MGLTQVLTGVGIATSIGGRIFGGLAADKAAKDEAHAIEREAFLARQETLEEAKRLDEEHQRFLARQSVMFLKGGVTLSGSPLLVLELTREEKDKQIRALKNRADALYNLGRRRASRVSSAGRAKLIGGFLGAATSGTGMFAQARGAGIF